MKIPREVKKGWEQRFPELSGKWTHWKITGDEYPLAIVDGLSLIEALNIVAENYGRYATIKASRAAVDKNGELAEEDKALFEISNFKIDERLRLSLDTPNI
jgi:hypothetical protein